jgi:putative salt-induced outer membrane protein YdiY
MSSRYLISFVCLWCTAFALLNGQAAWAEKTDRLILENGDKFTGEIKKLEFGKLTFSTDHMGTISIKWDKIIGLTSAAYYEVELFDGTIYFGALGDASLKWRMTIITDSSSFEIYRFYVVRLLPIKDRFWARVDGAASVGFNYTKASEIFQFNAEANASYHTRILEAEGNFSSTITTQQDTSATERYEFDLLARRIFEDRWFALGEIGAQSNSALGLNLRLLLNGGLGRKVIQNNSEWLMTGGGLAVNREWTGNWSKSTNNLEAIGALQFSKFRYDDPELNLTTGMALFANLTNFGRVRMEIDANVAWEVISDLFLNLTFYDSFDNEPPSDAAKNDWGIVFSFGYTF